MLVDRTAIVASVLLLTSAIGPAAGAQDLNGAVSTGDLDAVREALPPGTGADPGSLVRPLYFAARDGHSAIVAYLLEEGAPADAATSFGSALQIAARGNHVPVLTLLLDAGADPDLMAGEESRTALHDAAERGALDAARLLLERGAEVNARTKMDHPPIHLAARRERAEMVAYLAEAGASPRAVDAIAATELDAADAEAGRIAAEECRGCHAMEAGAPPPGRFPAPSLAGIVGREKAVQADFPYTAALSGLDGSWTQEEIDRFIADPTGVAPGTAMGHAGIQDRAKRIAIIAHLISLQAE